MYRIHCGSFGNFQELFITGVKQHGKLFVAAVCIFVWDEVVLGSGV